MELNPALPEDIDEYIASFPPEIQEILQNVRKTIQLAAPDAKEAIKYQIPTFTLAGNLVSFAAYKNHIGVYPVPVGDEKFQKEISMYKSGKSTARFPLGKPIPYELISQIVKLRLTDHQTRTKG